MASMTIEPRPDELLGKRFGRGRFVVASRLGGGAYGDVYLARDEGGQPAAIKFLREAEADRVAVERFRREGRKFGAVLKHPNVVRVLGFGTEASRFLIISEYI